MDNKMLMLAAVVLIGGFMMGGSSAEKRYYVPGTGYVPESQLPQMGYVNIGGQWYSQAQVDAAAAQAGVSSGTVQPGTSAWTAIAQILAGVAPLITTIGNYVDSNNNNNNSGMGNGNTNSGGMGGVFGPSAKVCSRAGHNLSARGRSIDGKQLAMCRWK